MSFHEKFSNIMGNLVEKVDDNKYLSAMKNSFTFYMPFALSGSFAMLGTQYLASEETGLARFETFNFLTNLRPAFSAINFATLGIMSVMIIFLLGMQLAKANGANQFLTAMVALSAYITVVPQSVSTIVDDVEHLQAGLPVTTIDASGLFVGMILTMIVVEFFNYLCNIDRLKIKMPSSVPAAVSSSFNTIIPIFLTLITVSILGRLFVIATGNHINAYIYEILQAPMELLIQSPIGIIPVVIFAQLFWLVGIHGGAATAAIRSPLFMSAIAANITAYEAGLVPGNPVTQGAWRSFITLGGSGLVLSLLIAIFIASKKQDDRVIAKLGFVPAICGISEPIVFGLPLVLNFTYAIPFVLSSTVATALLMFASHIGFIIPNIVDVPFGLPIFVNGFLGWGINGAILQAIIVGLGVLLYLPFVLLSNRKRNAEEA